MTAPNPFFEIDREDGTAPFDWCVAPDQPVRIRFGVRREAGCVAAGVAVTTHAGAPPVVVQASPDPGGEGGPYRLFRVDLPPLGRETALRYRLGFRTADGRAVWHPDVRVVVVTAAPAEGAAVTATFLGRVAGRPVYGPQPRQPVTPSPASWRNRTYYSLILDRFSAGAPDRRGFGFVPFDPADPFASHGGTFAGCRDRLDYLTELGIGGLILSPVYLNAPDGYHGYHPLHLFAVDPRFGTLKDLRDLIAAAHERGMVVLLDVLVNHMADAIVWSEDARGLHGQFRYDLGDRTVPLPYPRDLRSTAFFHDGAGTDPIRSPLFGFLADWRTEHPFVRDVLVKHLEYWIAETDCDGFRFDAVRHVDPEFWRHALDKLRLYTAAIGKSDFFLLGEHAAESAEVAGAWGKRAGFTGMIDYPLHYRLRAIFDEGRADLRALAPHFNRECFAHRDSRLNLAFLDNQDTSRFLHRWGERFGGLAPARRRLHAALALVMLGPELPCLYYGTEQEFSGAIGWYGDEAGHRHGHDCHVREDMAANPQCAWRFGPINRPLHPPYDTTNPTFRTIAALARLRAATPAIHAGDRYAVIDDDPWLVAWLMAEPETGALVLVAINFWEGRVERDFALAAIAPMVPATVRHRLDGAGTAHTRFVLGEATGGTIRAGRLTITLDSGAVLVLALADAGPGTA